MRKSFETFKMSRSAFQADLPLAVYFIADPSVCRGRPLPEVLREALEGGVTLVQLRDKVRPPSELFNEALLLRDICHAYDVPFIVDDHVELARDVEADGVHVGQEDMDPAHARQLIGEEMILGLTAFTEEHIRAVDPDVVDYIGTGPVYATQTKPDKTVLGPEGLAGLVALSPVPVVGIGGITPENAGAVIKAGANGVAMMRAVSEAVHADQAARAFVEVVRDAR